MLRGIGTRERLLAASGIGLVGAVALVVMTQSPSQAPGVGGTQPSVPASTPASSIDVGLSIAPDDGRPVVIDAENAVRIVERAAAIYDSNAIAQGPFKVPHQPGRYWAIDLGGPRFFVGTLSGDLIPEVRAGVLGSDEYIPSVVDISTASASADAAAARTLGARAVRESFSIGYLGQPPHEFWCGKYHDGLTKHYFCVDLVTGATEKLQPEDLGPPIPQGPMWDPDVIREAAEWARAAWELIPTLGRDELLQAQLTVADGHLEEAGSLFRSEGVDVLLADPDTNFIQVMGPWRAVLSGLDSVDPLTLQYDEDRSALRPLAAPASIVMAEPMSPYDAWPTGVQVLREGPLSADDELMRRMTDEVARALRTLGGDVYERLSAYVSCDEVGLECRLWVGGTSCDGADSYVFAARPDDWHPQLVESHLGSIHRSVVRQAERIARLDTEVAPRIATYETFHDALWLIDRPGVVELIYRRPALPAAAFRGPIATTGDYADYLHVYVDIGQDTVVEVKERLYGSPPPA